MSDQFYGARFHTSDDVEMNKEDMSRPVINSDAYASHVPADVIYLPETPVDGTLSVVSPVNEIPVQDVSMAAGTAVAVVSPMYETLVHEAPKGEAIPSYIAPVSETIIPQVPGSAALLSREESEHFRTHWNEIQGMFVDEPRVAVLQADALVSEVIMQITRMFTDERSSLESQWNQGNDVSTEDLRKALKRYRSFFNRLVV
jgi:hypothetical protein